MQLMFTFRDCRLIFSDYCFHQSMFILPNFHWHFCCPCTDSYIPCSHHYCSCSFIFPFFPFYWGLRRAWGQRAGVQSAMYNRCHISPVFCSLPTLLFTALPPKEVKRYPFCRICSEEATADQLCSKTFFDALLIYFFTELIKGYHLLRTYYVSDTVLNTQYGSFHLHWIPAR